MSNCLNCGKPLIKGQSKYCSNLCQASYQRTQFIEQWKQGKIDGATGNAGLSAHIRTYLLQKANYKCSECGWGIINPFSGEVPLEIHHINGDAKDNTPDNLKILCPNCHALTENFKALNRTGRSNRHSTINTCIDCGISISGLATRCPSCAAKQRIIPVTALVVTREELKSLIRNTPFTKIAKQFNVTDNTIRDWCRKYNLPSRVRDIKEYNDEQWQLI